MLKFYAVYCSNQPNIRARLQEYTAENAPLESFLKKCFWAPQCRKLDFESFLIKPLQRLCKYPLLLRVRLCTLATTAVAAVCSSTLLLLRMQELMKYTGQEHGDFVDLTNAYQKIVTIVDQVNERVRKVENVARLLEVSSKFENTEVRWRRESIYLALTWLTLTCCCCCCYSYGRTTEL